MNPVKPGVVVAAFGVGPAVDLARALAARAPDHVALIGDPPASREAVADAFAAAARQIGAIGHVVLSAVPAAALVPGDFDTISRPQWQAASHAAVKATLWGLQAAHAHLADGGAISLLGPNLGLTGAARLVPLCMALEAQRALAKSAARQWGARGVRINWIAVSPQAFGLPAHLAPAVPELGPPPPALNRELSMESDIAPLLRFLGSADANGVTGQTLNLDGGHWMLP